MSNKSKAPAKPDKGSRRRRAGVLALIVFGALCIFISTLSLWIRDVALDPDEWANTSSQVLQSEDVRNVLSVYIVDQTFAASDAEARLEETLPERLKPLAGPLSAQLRGVAYDAVARALERPRVQELWRSANRADVWSSRFSPRRWRSRSCSPFSPHAPGRRPTTWRAR